VDELIELELVRLVGPGDSRGGRPAVVLEFNPDAAFALGASMQDYSWTVVRTNLNAHIMDRTTVTMTDASVEAAVEAIAEGVNQILDRCDERRLLPGIGLGPPGLVDIASGRIVSAADVGWSDVPFANLVSATTGFPAIVANRSKVGALAEYWYASGDGVEDLIYVSVGTGVAAGIIHHGELYVGTNSSAGELGHITVVPDGPPCACGNRGCLQQLVSEDAIAQRARLALRSAEGGELHDAVGAHPEQLSASRVLEAADHDDETAAFVVREAADYLAVGVATLVNLFNPQVVYLGGPVIEQSRLLYQRVAEEVRRRAMAYPLSALRIRHSTLGADSSAVGASVLVLKQADTLLFSEAERE
jgi:glucokinase-like ROK family protein